MAESLKFISKASGVYRDDLFRMNVIRYDMIEEFNVDSKAEYTA